MEERISFSEMYMQMAQIASKRSTCLRRKVGAVAVKDNHILCSGYNGAPKGCEHCSDIGACLRQELHIPSGERHEICRAVHAEQNLLTQAAYHGISLEGCVVYITCSPCAICSKLLINAGVSKIVYDGDYPDESSFQYLSQAGVEVEKFTIK